LIKRRAVQNGFSLLSAFSVIQHYARFDLGRIRNAKLSDGKHAPFRSVRGSHTMWQRVIGWARGRTFWAMVA
jgi:hypothetical protein